MMDLPSGYVAALEWNPYTKMFETPVYVKEGTFQGQVEYFGDDIKA